MAKSAYGDVESVAAHLGVSPRTVRRYMASGGLKHYKPDSAQQGRVLIKWADLDAWLERHAVERHS